MIYGNSTDPVLIKKIFLKVWSLRDEITNVIQQKIANGENPKKINIEALLKEYKNSDQKLENSPPALTIVSDNNSPEASETEEAAKASVSESGEELEAMMAEAMGGGGESTPAAPETEDAAKASVSESGEELEAMMAEAMGGGEDSAPAATPETKENNNVSGNKTIIQRRSDGMPQDKVHHGVCILSELEMNHMYFFSDKLFLEGQSIIVEFQVPKKFVINLEVAYCRAYNLKSRIISEKRLRYRVVAKFSFLKEGEKTLLRQFITSIEPDAQEAASSAAIVKPTGGGGNDDDFDELDDLDL